MSAERPGSTWGEQVRDLLGAANAKAWIIAPFIKKQAFEYLLKELRPECEFVCVTRWLPADVAAGVSDTEILDLIDAREGSELRLLDDLHAKLFAGDVNCLVGSANVTLKGLGLRSNSNTELLVKALIADDAVKSFLDLVMARSRLATVADAEQVNQLAAQLRAPESVTVGREFIWLPTSQRPENAYEWYTNARIAGGHRLPVQERTLMDLAGAAIPPGLTEEEFNSQVESRLLELPGLEEFAAGGAEALRLADFEEHLQALVDSGLCGDLAVAWHSLVLWISHFVINVTHEVEGEYVLIRGELA